MFIAKLLDQKQGEAKVVDHKQVLRDRLDHWLKTRPPAADLLARGILGRGPRFAAAREVVDQFLRARVQAQLAEAIKIPAGTFEYTDRVCALLAHQGGAADEGDDPCPALEERLRSVHRDCEATRSRLQAADEAWCRASEDCRRTVCTGALREAAFGANTALDLLEAHRTSTGDSLADVFSDLRAFQRLAARRSCLEGIVSVVKKTDAIREAVFACRGIAHVPLSTLEELPELCAALPSRSQGIGVRRLQFLISPLRTMIVQDLQENLRKTQQWPLDPKASARQSVGTSGVEIEVIRLCASMQRVQHVHNDLKRRLEAKVLEDETDEGVKGPWACSALAAPLIAWCRRLFQKPELCRMDKPEWTLNYIVKLSTEYGALLEKWMTAAQDKESGDAALEPPQILALKGVDLPAGLAVALACEVRRIVRARMPVLVEPEERPTLLHTLRHLVRFHGEIAELGGPAAAAAAFADFDANRPLREPPAVEPSNIAATESPAVAEPTASSLMSGLAHLQKGGEGIDGPSSEARASAPGAALAADGGFMSGLSHLRRSEQEPAETSGFMAGLSHLRGGVEEAPEPAAPSQTGKSGSGLMAGLSRLKSVVGEELGMASERVVSEEGAVEQVPDPGPPRGLRAGTDNLLTGFTQFAEAVVEEALNPEQAKPQVQGFLDVWADADADFVGNTLQQSMKADDGAGWRRRPLRVAAAESAKEEPEVMEISTLIADLFDKSRCRAECLANPSARATYSDRVLGSGLRKVVAALRERWNALSDPLKEARDAAVLVETLEEMCRFLDRFPLGVHFIATVDDTSTLRLGMVDKLAESLVGNVRPVLRQLHMDTGVFSDALGPPLMILWRRLRPSNFLAVAQRSLRSIADLLLKELLWHAPFADREETLAFVTNCRDDLGSVLASTVDASELACLRAFWDGCALLALPEQEAANVLVALRKVARCSPTHALRSLQSGETEDAPDGQTDADFEPPVIGEVLRQRRAEVFAAAGIKELPVPDAITVLGKRPELTGSLSDLQDAPFGLLQDLIPGHGLAQLGAGALQQLHGVAPLPAAALASSAAGAAAEAAQVAAAQARHVQAGVAELKSLLPGRLISSVGQVASTLRPLGS